MALGEESDRQVQEVPDEGRGHLQAELGLHTEQGLLLQPDEPGLEQRRHDEAEHQRREPVLEARHQHLVDEHLREPREGEARQHQQQARGDDEGEAAGLAVEVAQQRADHAGGTAAAFEGLTGFEGEHDAGEGLLELVHGDAPRPLGGVVQQRVAVLEALEDHVVAEVPVDDHRQRQIGQLLRLLAEALRRQAETSCGLQQIAGLAAVARHAAARAQQLERLPAAVVGEDHGERSRAAFDGLHLQDRRHAARFHSTNRCRKGMSSTIGGTSRTVMPAVAVVPAEMPWSGPKAELQA